MRRLDLDLQLCAAAAILCAVGVVTVPLTAVRALLAIPLCLVLPGYAVASGAFGPARITGVRLLMLVPAVSLAILALAALLLQLTPDGLGEASWTIVLVVVVLGGCAVAAGRREGLWSGARGGSNAPPRPHDGAAAHRAGELDGRLPVIHWPRLRARDLLLLALAGLIAAAALVFSRTPLPAPNAIGYAQLWMLPSGTPRSPAVHIGVISDQQRPTTYRLELSLGSAAPLVVAQRISLKPGAQMQLSVPLDGLTQPQSLVVARLYVQGSRSPYRQVTALVDASPRR